MAKRTKVKASELSRKQKHVSRRVQQQQRMILIGAVAFVVVLAGILGWGYLDQTVFQARKPVAKVNGEVITVGQFQKRVRFQRATYVMQTENLIKNLQTLLQNPMLLGYFGQQLQAWTQELNNPQTMGQKVIQGLVDETLIIQEAKARGITVTEAEVDQALQEAWGYYPNGTPTPEAVPTEMPTPTYSPTQLALLPPTPTPLPPTATPAASPTPTATFPPTVPPPTPTPYTKEAYQKAFQNYLDQMEKLAGLSEEDIRDIMRDQIYRKKLYEAITANLPHTQEEVLARHILVKDEKTAQEVRQKLLNGGSWSELAKEYSIDPGSKDKGGMLGWFGRGQMVKAFEDAAFSLKVGEISQPVQTQYGWHIIQVLGHEERPMTTTQIENAKDQAFREWLQQVRDQADIETYDLWRKYVPTEPDLSPQLKAQLQQFLLSMQQPQPPALPTPAGGTSTDGQNQP